VPDNPAEQAGKKMRKPKITQARVLVPKLVEVSVRDFLKKEFFFYTFRGE
jgi:hypothetical protein